MKKGKLVLYIVLIIVLAGAFALVVCSKFFAAPQEAYAAEVESSDTGIINSSVWNGNSTEPTQTLYFSNNGESNQSRGVIQFEPIQTNKEYTINIAFIGKPLISNNRQAISYVFNTQGNFTGATYGSTTQTIDPDGMTEINLTYTDTQAVNYFIFEFYNNANSTGTANEYWVNMLLFQIGDGNGNYLVNYQSYLYDYLKTQFDNANSSGYENGMNDGESIYRNNPFNGASLISVITKEQSHEIKGVGLNILSNGVGFSSINQAVDKYFSDNEIESRRYTVTFKILPFVFEENQILISRSLGFYSLYFTDTDNNSYQIQETSERNSDGWFFLSAANSDAYGKQIEEIQITFANTDYVGTLYVGQTAAQNSAYNEGYDRGYKNGLAESVGSLTGWDAVRNGLTSIFGALNIKIFGLFSLGDLMGIVLIFSVVMFFLKIIRG